MAEEKSYVDMNVKVPKQLDVLFRQAISKKHDGVMMRGDFKNAVFEAMGLFIQKYLPEKRDELERIMDSIESKPKE